MRNMAGMPLSSPLPCIHTLPDESRLGTVSIREREVGWGDRQSVRASTIPYTTQAGT